MSFYFSCVSILLFFLSYRDLILPRMRGGRSLDNLHRVSFGDGGAGGAENQPSLGEPGTFVSHNYACGLAKGSGIILYWVW